MSATGNSASVSNPSSTAIPLWEVNLLLAIDAAWKYVIAVPAVFGLIGNLLSFLIAMKKDNRHLSICCYIAGTAIMDSYCLVLGFTFVLLECYFPEALKMDRKTYFKLSWSSINTSAMTSGLYISAMTVDRLIAVRFPMKAAIYCTVKRAWWTMALCFLAMSTFNVYFWVIGEIQTNIFGPDLLVWRAPEGQLWLNSFVSALQVTLATIVPFLIIFIGNVLIIITYRRRQAERRKLTGKSGKADQASDAYLTRMLIFVAIAYMITSLPRRLYQSLRMNEIYDMTNKYWAYRYELEFVLTDRFWFFNFAVNFYMYCIGGGKKFRNDAYQILTCQAKLF